MTGRGPSRTISEPFPNVPGGSRGLLEAPVAPVQIVNRTSTVVLAWALTASASAQGGPRPDDHASPETVVAANYATLQRPPGGAFAWDRKTSLFLPQAVQVLATGDNHILLSPEVYRRWADSYTPQGDPDDPGFEEREIHRVTHRYGDVAQVFSTYEKAPWDSDDLIGRGINAYQLVRQPDGDWHIVSVIWDEESGAGPIPARYGGLGPGAEPDPLPGPEDFATPLAVVDALYETVQRSPGEGFDWARMRSLFLPEAVLIPNTEQSGGEFRVETPGSFIECAERFTTVGGPDDQGFAEEQVHAIVDQYGDVAQVFSTYEKRFYTSSEILGRGINSVQLVRHDGRWWIVSIAWDEESGAGPIPTQYLPE